MYVTEFKQHLSRVKNKSSSYPNPSHPPPQLPSFSAHQVETNRYADLLLMEPQLRALS